VHDSRFFRDLCTLFERGKENINIKLHYTYPNRTEFFHYRGDYNRILLGDRCFMTPFPFPDPKPRPVTMPL